MKTLSIPPVRNEPSVLAETDIEFLRLHQYRQDRHRALVEAFLVVIRSHPEVSEKRIFSSAFHAAGKHVFPASSEEA